MQQHIQSIVKHLFQKDTLQEVTEDELRSFTETHPYSAVGQFLFARKLQEAGSDQIETQAEKASLYFHNPTWTSWLLTGDQMRWDGEVKAPVIEEKATEEPAQVTEHTNEHVPEPTVAVQETVEETTAKVELPAETIEQPAIVEHNEQIAQPPVSNNEQPATDNQQPTTSSQPEEELVFQSYHTIDYFASQGIKLKAEDFTKDKFGKQLKSFTEWLRSMKRVTPATMSEQMDEASRQAIQQFADHSVEGKDAETEAMAEVWAKQGNIAKAIDVYSKLSLLNPAKRAYFAARIEQLKAS